MGTQSGFLLSRYRLTRSGKTGRIAALLGMSALFATPLAAQAEGADAYRAATARIIAEATKAETGNRAWHRVAELTDKYPARTAGSTNLEGAIRWATERLKQDGLSNVRVDKVMVPHWVRSEEKAAIVGQYAQKLTIAALGGSIGTGDKPVQAQVLVVKSFDELEARAAEVKGKIVVYNVPFDEAGDPIKAYSAGTPYRGAGASRAAKLGAVGALVRSVGPVGHMTPHTGAMRYADDAPKIPVAGLAAEDVAKLQRMQDRGDRVTVSLSLGAHQLPDAESGNVIAELKGREKPDEIVLLGCHIDSWDLAAGAMDDAGGCSAIWEAVLLLKQLKLQPRRTIRIVFFTNEENGVSGGRAYAEQYKDTLAKHRLAIETDDGQLPIKGYGFRGTEQSAAVMKEFVPLMSGLGGTVYRTNAVGGSDIQALVRGGNVPVITLDVDMSRYFHIHHTNADTVDKIVPADLGNLTGALASWAYIAAEMPQPLDRAPVAKAP
jgi:carboxypeptidase Q